MKKNIIILLLFLLYSDAFAQIESSRQVQWGFIAFISRIVLIIFIGGSFVSGFLFVRELKIKVFSRKSRRRHKRHRMGRQHTTSKQHAPGKTKKKNIFRVFLIVSLSAAIITYYIYLKAIQEYQTPEPEAPIEVAPTPAP